MNRTYLETARLLTQVAPLVLGDDTFALKGGTAINLFVRDMPRLSVDMDIVFPDHRPEREHALNRISAAIREAADRLRKRGFQTYTVAAADATETTIWRGQVSHCSTANIWLGLRQKSSRRRGRCGKRPRLADCPLCWTKFVLSTTMDNMTGQEHASAGRRCFTTNP